MPPKRSKPPIQPETKYSESEPELHNDEEDDGRPICEYDERCYRKNPLHFKEYRHPNRAKMLKDNNLGSNKTKKASHLLKKTLSNEIIKSTSARSQLEMYKSVVRVTLAGETHISTESKKMLKKLRMENNISEKEHDQIISQFGWTPDEYEEGEKSDSLIDLEEERKVLADPNGFKRFRITRNQKRNKEQEIVWSKASSQFYQTMSTSQSNFIIHSIEVICNSKLIRQYNEKRAAMGHGKKKITEEWGFHGTSEEYIDSIAEQGFKHPDELDHVDKLDDGFFGKGIYFSMYSDYAMYYSVERNSSKILLCKLLTGKVYHCDERMDGKSLVKGYDSHYSPKGNEIIIFNSHQILPRYIIEFEERESEEREQEY